MSAIPQAFDGYTGGSMAGPGNQQPDFVDGFVADPELTDYENNLRQEQFQYDNGPYAIDTSRALSPSDQYRLEHPPEVQNPGIFSALMGIAANDPAYNTVNAGDINDRGSVGPNGGNGDNSMVPRSDEENRSIIAAAPLEAAKNLAAFGLDSLPSPMKDFADKLSQYLNVAWEVAMVALLLGGIVLAAWVWRSFK